MRDELNAAAIETICNAGNIPLSDYIENRYSYLTFEDKVKILTFIEEMFLEGEE